MEEKRIKLGEYEIVMRLHDEDNLLEVVVLDALGDEIEGLLISDDNGEDNIKLN